MSDPTIDQPSVVKADGQYEIHVDTSGKAAGFTVFLDVEGKDGTERIFPHTVVEEEYSGHGLASTLVRGALEATIADGLKIVAVCPYVKAWIKKHPDYQEHTVPTQPRHLEALRA